MDIEQTSPNPSALFRTICALLDVADRFTSNKKKRHSNATNTNSSSIDDHHDPVDNYNEQIKEIGIQSTQPLNQQTNDSNVTTNEYSLIDEIDCSGDDVINASSETNKNLNQLNDQNAFRNHSSINNFVKCSNNNIIIEKEIPLATRQRTFNRKTPNSLDLFLSNTTLMATDSIVVKRRKLSAVKRSYNQMNATGKYVERFPLIGIDEECEYDSDIGKFICKTNDPNRPYDVSGIRTSSGSSDSELNLSDFNVTPKQQISDKIDKIEQIQIESKEKIVTKRIEFFEKIGTKLEENQSCEMPNADKQFSTILCLSTFMIVVVTLYFFPLPN